MRGCHSASNPSRSCEQSAIGFLTAASALVASQTFQHKHPVKAIAHLLRELTSQTAETEEAEVLEAAMSLRIWNSLEWCVASTALPLSEGPANIVHPPNLITELT